MTTREVNITIQVDASQYHDVPDTVAGTLDLVRMMILGDADLPDQLTITCEGRSLGVNEGLLCAMCGKPFWMDSTGDAHHIEDAGNVLAGHTPYVEEEP